MIVIHDRFCHRGSHRGMVPVLSGIILSRVHRILYNLMSSVIKYYQSYCISHIEASRSECEKVAGGTQGHARRSGRCHGGASGARGKVCTRNKARWTRNKARWKGVRPEETGTKKRKKRKRRKKQNKVTKKEKKKKKSKQNNRKKKMKQRERKRQKRQTKIWSVYCSLCYLCLHFIGLIKIYVPKHPLERYFFWAPYY